MESKRGSDNTGKVKELINMLRKNKEFHNEFRNNILRNYGIAGQRMEDWDRETSIRIPNDAKPHQCREVLINIDNKTEEISGYLRRAKVSEASLRALYEQKYDEAFGQCYQEALTAKEQNGGKRLPAKDTLSALADKKCSQAKYALHLAQVETIYFKQLLDKLNSQREDVKSILIALGIEAKAMKLYDSDMSDVPNVDEQENSQ